MHRHISHPLSIPGLSQSQAENLDHVTIRIGPLDLRHARNLLRWFDGILVLGSGDDDAKGIRFGSFLINFLLLVLGNLFGLVLVLVLVGLLVPLLRRGGEGVLLRLGEHGGTADHCGG